jgi:hypothetical protein
MSDRIENPTAADPISAEDLRVLAARFFDLWRRQWIATSAAAPVSLSKAATPKPTSR